MNDDGSRGLGVALILAVVMLAIYLAIGVWIIH